MNLLQCLCLFKHVKVQGHLVCRESFHKGVCSILDARNFRDASEKKYEQWWGKKLSRKYSSKNFINGLPKTTISPRIVCFFPIGPIWTRLYPINQSFDLLDGRPQSPPIAPLLLTRLSPDFINELPARESPWRGLFLLLNSFYQSTVKLYYIRKLSKKK